MNTPADETTHRYALVGEWLWEYDGDDRYPSRMYWAPNHKHPEPMRTKWCRVPHCPHDVIGGGEFCPTHEWQLRKAEAE